jgi:hypothetical protein
VVVVVDRPSLPNAATRPYLEAAAGLLERLAPTEFGAVWTIPAERKEFAFTTDRGMTRAALLSATGTKSLQPGRFAISPAEASRIARGIGNVLDLVAERECPTSGDRDEQTRCREELRREAMAQTDQARVEANATARDLALLVRALRAVKGFKHLVLLTGGGGVDVGDAVRAIAADAARGRVTVHAIVVGAADPGASSRRGGVGQGEEDTLEGALAAATGGVTAGGRDAAAAVARVERELAAEYLATLTLPGPQDDGRLHDLDVRVSRPEQASARAPRQVVFDAPAVAVAPPPAPPVAAPPPTPLVPPAPPPEPSAPPKPALDQLPLEVLVSRAASYLARFTAEMATAVLEERYVQLVKRWVYPPTAPDEQRLTWRPNAALTLRDTTEFKRRQTKADLLLVQLPDRTWAAYRDTFEADGRVLEGREGRLRKLFVEGTQDSERQMRRINQNSADWNLGGFYREINLPTFGLLMARPDNQARMAFTLGQTARIGDVTCRIVSFKEVARPTLVRSLKRGENVPLAGSLCVDEEGTIWRTRFDLDERFTARGVIEVTYAPHPRMKVLVPSRMWEWYLPPGPVGVQDARAIPLTVPGYIEALATYSNLRQFTVETTEQVK